MQNFTNWISGSEPVTWGLLILTFAGLLEGRRIYLKNARNNRKAKIFDELSRELETAKDEMNKIIFSVNDMTGILAYSANKSIQRFNLRDKKKWTEKEKMEMFNLVEKVYSTLDRQIKIVNSCFMRINNTVNKIEENTFLSTDSKRATRLLYIELNIQYEMLSTITDVFLSFKFIPPPNQLPNVDGTTFNKVAELIRKVSARNYEMAGYIDDLKVILHNDLVRKLYHKAEYSSRDRRLTTEGFTNKAADKSIR